MGVRIRAHDWAATPVGPPESWPQSLKTALGIMLHCGSPMYIAWGPDFIQFYNDAYAPLLSSDGLGRNARATLASGWSSTGPLFQDVMQDGWAGPLPESFLPQHQGASGGHLSFSCGPILDETGAPGGILITAQESAASQGAREAAALALDRSEARLAFALRAGRLGYWEVDPATRALFASDIYKENWGRTPADTFTYETLKSAIHPDDLALHEEAVTEALDKAGTLDVEYRVIWPDGSVHWLRARGHATYDSAGNPQRMAGISLDITDRKQIEENLRDETAALEQLNALGTTLAANLDIERILQNVTDAATEVSGAQFGAFFHNVLDEHGESYTLYTISGVPRETFSKFPMPRNTAVFNPTFQGVGTLRSDDIRKDVRYGKNAPFFGMPVGHLPVVSYLAVPVISRSGKVLGGLFFGHGRAGAFTERAERVVAGIAAQAAIAIDNASLFAAAQSEIAERRRVEKHQDLLLAELNHRVRNTLAIVQSIAGQTLRHADSAISFRTGFEARIMALSEAHKLLTDSNWEGAALSAIVDRVLSPYAAGTKPRYTIAMDADVRVAPNTAVSLVMAFHELATNAAKYGALSTSSGQVNISCKVTTGKTSPRLNLHWEETGGPVVKMPSRKGFGSRLIRSLSEDTGGKVRLEFAPNGLTCEFDIPLVLANQT
jgi:PAS domain S-box-containing protein